MPAPGDQHQASLANPFEEPQKRISEYTAQEIATLQSRLEKQLGPEYISSRSGPSGQKVHYIAAEKCITLANEVFGFNGWSSSIQNLQVDFVDEHPQTMRVSLGLSVIVRVTLRDGTYHEDIGYGHIENCKGKAAAFEKAKKEGTTDGLKRALRNFGNVLGNCIYDKAYLDKVTKLKTGPTKFDSSRLHRHSDYVKKEEKEKVEREQRQQREEQQNAVKREHLDSLGLEDLLDADFDDADFAMADEGHPDEVALPPTMAEVNSAGNASNTNQNMQPPGGRPFGGNQSGPQTPVPGGAARPNPQQHGPYQNRSNPPNQPKAPSNQPVPANPANAGNEPIAFFSARAVTQQAAANDNPNTSLPMPSGNQVFNPKAESPSIRKTPGIDHTSSKPLARNGQHVAPTPLSQSQQGPSTGSNGNGFTPVRPSGAGGNSGAAAGGMAANPQLGRRIGAPTGPSSPLANRGSYRPPTMKRPPPSDGSAGGPPLADVTNSKARADTGSAGIDAAKRQKTT